MGRLGGSIFGGGVQLWAAGGKGRRSKSGLMTFQRIFVFYCIDIGLTMLVDHRDTGDVDAGSTRMMKICYGIVYQKNENVYVYEN